MAYAHLPAPWTTFLELVGIPLDDQMAKAKMIKTFDLGIIFQFVLDNC